MALLTLIDGLLRVSGNDLVRSASAEEPCCCSDCPEECQITTFGLTESGSGWSVEEPPEKLPIEVTFTYENAAGCAGGTNPNPQGGVIQCCFRLSEAGDVELRVSGNTEREQINFDVGEITVGNVLARIKGTEEYLGCQMGNQSDTKVVNLPAGVHTYIFNADTGDGAYHQNMVHTFRIKRL